MTLFRRLPGLRSALAALLCASIALLSAGETPAPAMPFIGGVGGVYFLAEPGELIIDVEKCDLNRRETRTELRAILVSPDRRVLQEAVIPDDGAPRGKGRGPVQTCRLATRVERKGVYVLNLTVAQDRYGEEMVWRFRSNCASYLIETARGHKDARHEEPIVLASPGRAADVAFWPHRAAMKIELSGLPPRSGAPQLVDANGTNLGTFSVDAKGNATHELGPDASRRDTPWRLRFPSAQAVIQIDGVTRWDRGDLLPDACLWTPDAGSWFTLRENRWLLTPYNRSAFGEPGERKEIAFLVRNDSEQLRSIQVGLDFPAGRWPVRLSAERVVVPAGRTATVTAECIMPARGESRTVFLLAMPEDNSGFTTYSSLTVTGGRAPASQPLALPVVLRAYRHENEQFGYLPDYPLEHQMYFNPQNRPFVRLANGLAALEGGRWRTTVTNPPSTPASSKIAFDRENRVYLLANAGGWTALQYSTDGGRTFAAATIPPRDRPARAFDLEEFTGHNPLAGPPPILRYTLTEKDPKLFWRSLNDLELFLPRWENGQVVIGEPILVTKQCIGLATHSGIPASVVSRGSKVHIVWGEATDPAAKAPGVPVCAATYDRATGKLSERVVLGYGPPANDIHNSPSITMDQAGYLNVLGGTHGKPFPYARSLNPNDAAAGWTPAAVTGEAINQTYVGLVCGPDDTLYSVFRYWRYHAEPFPASTHATLAFQRKRPGQPWEPPRVLIVSPFSEYSVFYHRLTIDRAGRLFVSYDYWSTFWFYRNDTPDRRRTVLLSPDGGETWKFAGAEDFR